MQTITIEQNIVENFLCENLINEEVINFDSQDEETHDLAMSSPKHYGKSDLINSENKLKIIVVENDEASHVNVPHASNDLISHSKRNELESEVKIKVDGEPQNHEIATVEVTVEDKEKPDKSSSGVRRSSRIKTISVLKQKSKGRGLVKNDKNLKREVLKHPDFDQNDSNSSSSLDLLKSSDIIPISKVPQLLESSVLCNAKTEFKPVKVKSRWRRSSEMEMSSYSPSSGALNATSKILLHHSENSYKQKVRSNELVDDNNTETLEKTNEELQFEKEMEERLRNFTILNENDYHCERTICKEAKKMVCDCFLTKEEVERGELGCGDDCLNRLLMIECGSRCVVGSRCTNRRFQNNQYATCKVFKTEKKGFGIQAKNELMQGDFIMEYVGEVLNTKLFKKRAEIYSKTKNKHYYFMALKSDTIIDATVKGNISRFINHSCDPNSETQKWTVNGELRIGFFSKREIAQGEEITFDYQFQRYGKEAQRCYCEASCCRGWIGEEPDEDELENDLGDECDE